ncbi:mannosyl phosphorylinositol ceramide synthase sur1 [Stemphylium lycopersici]|nr:mannosyl phosphorylinositol ceramide synthase sur1 [Stemphylium lycopersici]RAR04187.1 mannosyl phosphorylinositol ceramide synthase sur1 [Stemphylium lycopersici]
MSRLGIITAWLWLREGNLIDTTRPLLVFRSFYQLLVTLFNIQQLQCLGKMLYRQLFVRLFACATILQVTRVIYRQYSFQTYLQSLMIDWEDFPSDYAKALNESMLRGEQPQESDYAPISETKIPRIIHYIWFNNIYPDHETPAGAPSTGFGSPELCKKFNPGYEIRMWNATSARELLENEYPWFLPTYDSYQYPIQKVDALKYFALYHYGGVYMDLDVACRRSLDPLLEFPAWFPEASPLGVNNDLMASAAKHPIVKKMTEGLMTHNWNLLFPYLTIFWTTGPQFTTTILQEWYERCEDEQCFQRRHAKDIESNGFAILQRIFYSEEFTFFGHKPGGTWHGGDVAVVLWLVEHPWALASLAAAFFGTLAGIIRVRHRRATRWDAKPISEFA